MITRRDFLKGAAITGTACLVSPFVSYGADNNGYDTVIRNGTVYDGTLARPRIADIGIRGDRIAAIGNNLGNAARMIDASGLIVTPGFIDGHNHADLTFKIFAKERADAASKIPSLAGNHNYAYQGVTTIVTGNCGLGYAKTDDFYEILTKVKFGSNVYHLAPHGAIRQELFGDHQPQKLTPQRLEAMRKRIAEEIEAGAVGMSCGLEYAPGSLTDTEELIELAKVVKKYNGVYVTHIRDLTGAIYRDGRIGVMEALKEAIEIGKKANVPVQISHIQINQPINKMTATPMIELITRARAEGVDITADAYPYDAGSSWMTMLTPAKYKTDKGIKEDYKNAKGRAELKGAVEETFTYLGPEKTMIISYPQRTHYEGKNIKEVADMEGKTPADMYVDMVCSNDAPQAIMQDQDMRNVKEFLMKNDSVFVISDGWTTIKDVGKPHPRCYGAYPKMIKMFAMDEKIMDLSAIVRAMTSLPAEKFRMTNRGKLDVGYFADITLIDLQKLGDHATYNNPHQYSTGVEYLFVNGFLSIDKGKVTNERGGRVSKREM
ncbi:MAG: amidohydrolase family protein [Deltaproteobacteria bacterium]|nr:amidohydrolase family protein [Deltaproteobacteria bacterium]